MKKIVLNNTSIDIHGYKPGDCEELEKSLSVWNSSYYRWEPRGLMYDEDTEILKVPRGIDVSFLKSKLKCDVKINTEYNDYEKTKIRLKAEPRDESQIKSLAFLTGSDKFKYTKDASQLSLNLDTGEGKTYCVIASLCLLKCKSMIITHTDTIKNQWNKAFTNFTNIDYRRICNITGTKALEDLYNDGVDGYDIFLINHGTLKQYAKKYGWDKMNDLFQKLKIGVKVFDEAHIEFKSILNIDLNTNVFKTFYVTATLERTDISEDKVFKLCFKNVYKYGYESRETKRKHVKYIAVKFNSKPNYEDQCSIKGPKGFDRNAYIDYQIEKGMIFEVLEYVLKTFEKIDGKSLILSSKITSSEILGDKVKEWYPEKELKIYHSKMSKKDKEGYKESDVISSTPMSVGTGFDLPGLRYTIMTEPYNAKITCSQVIGRLREIPDEFTYHIELIDIGFPKVKDMYKKRLKTIKEKCHSISEVDY